MSSPAINLVSPYPIDPMPGWVADLRVSREPVWVFAYGSLMWNPEMRFAERLAPRSLAEEIDRLWVREMTGEVYRMTRLKMATAQGPVAGYAFTVRRDSRDYAGRLEPEAAATIIATSRGDRGTGRDYLANTVRHLDELGIRDDALHRIAALVASGSL
jgi:cation transport regulator ChaC